MSAAYPLVKHIHIALVTGSVALFAARGTAVLMGKPWAMRPGVRGLSVLVDSCLLLAGLGLWWMLGLALGEHAWLLTKLVLLVVYVLLGTFALKRAPTPAAKAVFLALALATVGHMAAVAVAHHPLGLWAP